MKKIIFLIPVFNDWESLKKLILQIDQTIKDIKHYEFRCIVVNDASNIVQPDIPHPISFKQLKILNMKKNRGHARCNAFGIRYISKNENFDYILLMDGDGEDRPIEIKSLIKKISENPNVSVVAKRIKRAEGPLFQFLYQTHKFLTYIFTGKLINFGNYSCLTKKDSEIISTKASLWSSYSGTVKKNLKNLSEIDSIRGLRYFGPSKMSFFKLVIHSLPIIAVFKTQVLIRSFLMMLGLFICYSFTGLFVNLISFSILLLFFFNSVILIISLRERMDDLINSQDNLEKVEILKH